MKIKTIGLIAPSGNIKDFSAIEDKIALLEKQYKVKKFYNKSSNSYLSDSDENRADFLTKAFLDDEVDLVLSIRGGYGAIRIVDRINYELIKNCNKYYAASSDATILLAALSKKTNIKCFHSLMLTNGFVENLSKNIQIIEGDIFNLELKPIKKMSAKGRLWGGNLSSLVSMFSGEQYILDDDIILFLEDLNEPLYKLDKMLYEIYRNEKLRPKIKGIIFGDFYFALDEIMPLFEYYANLFNTACYYSFDITHKLNNTTLPYAKFVSV